MVDQQRRRVEQEMTKLVDEIDRSYLRKMQATMHRCAARCCDDYHVSLDRVQQCVENCSKPLQTSQDYVQSEIQSFQNRLQRCVMECNDDIKMKMGPNPSQSDISKFTDMFETCATKCVDKHIDLIPQILKSMKTVLNKQQQDQQTTFN